MAVQLLTLSLTFLFCFLLRLSYFLMKTNKRKVRKSLKCVKEFSRTFFLFLLLFVCFFFFLNKTKSRQNRNRQRNVKYKQISFEVTRTWDCFRTWKVIFIMCFNNKYKYRTFYGGCYKIITKNKTSRK